MYGIDVNFLKDRQATSVGGGTQTGPTKPTLQQQQPIFIGLGVMVLLLVMPLVAMFAFDWQSSQIDGNINELNAELEKLNAENQRMEEVNQRLTAAKEEVSSLVTIFDQIKPLSAILQEISVRIPNSVQISSISHSAPNITIEGYAPNYDVVNDFLLTLQNSRFLDAKATKLVSARLSELPITVGNADNLAADNVSVQFPRGVQYQIVTQLNQIPARQLLPDLARNGAIGLVTRIQTLEEKGAFQ